MNHKCETCGAEVKIVGDTTKHYEPVYTNERVQKLVEALEFYADPKKYYMKERTINLQETTAVLHTPEPEKLPKEYKSMSYEVIARIKVDQGKTARQALSAWRGND